MKKRVVISGISAIHPLGASIEEICTNINTNYQDRFFAIKDFESPHINNRLKRKLDWGCFYGLHAASVLIRESLQSVDMKKTGVFLGNCLGGWSFTESQLLTLHQNGITHMSPYVATAWFPAALQGQISIMHDILGMSKTFSTNKVAGLQAIKYAAQMIMSGKLNAVVCGGYENISNNYIKKILSHSKTDIEFSDAAAFLLLEDYDHAVARGADIYCELVYTQDRFCLSMDDKIAVFTQNCNFIRNNIKTGSGAFILDDVTEIERSIIKDYNQVKFLNFRRKLKESLAVSGILEIACMVNYIKNKQEMPDSIFLLPEKQEITNIETFMIRRMCETGIDTTLGFKTL